MTRDEARTLVLNHAESFSRLFMECDGIQPTFVFEGKDGCGFLCPENMVGEEEKDITAQVAREVLKEQEAIWVLYASEAWTVTLEGDEAQNWHGRAGDHPDRVEVITYQFEGLDGLKVSARQQIFREPSGMARLGKVEFDPESMVSIGRFVDLLPRSRPMN
jgi:hypothetical protein